MSYWHASRLASAASSNPTLFASAQRLTSICPVPSSIVYCTIVDFSCVALIRPTMQIYPYSIWESWTLCRAKIAHRSQWPPVKFTWRVSDIFPGIKDLFNRTMSQRLLIDFLRFPVERLLNTAATQNNAPWPWAIQKVLATRSSHSGTRSCCLLPWQASVAA